MTQQYLNPYCVRQYYGYAHISRWAADHETSEPVAVAIHAVAATSQHGRSYVTGNPTPDEYETVEWIWSDPTNVELEIVQALLREYVKQLEFLPPPAEGWCWGDTFIYPAA